ncbi:MAG TPA: ABC transporter substrate-binding protein, partial [Solirubrobacterales bacterium]
EVVDDQFTVAGGTAAAKQLAQGEVMAAVDLAGAEAAVGAQPTLEASKIPYLEVALPLSKLEGSATTFSLGTPLELAAAAVPSFAAAELGAAGKKVGLIVESEDIYQEMASELEANAAEAGIEIADVETVDATASSFTPALFKLQSKGVEVVMLEAGLAVPGVLRDAKTIGYSPTWTGSGPWTTDFLNALSKGAMEGIQAVRSNGGIDTPGFEEFAKGWKGESPAGELGYLGWADAMNIVAMLERLGSNPSRSALVEMLETETEGDPIEATKAIPPLTYTTTRHWASDEVLPSVVKKGVWTATGEFTRRFGGE